MATKEIAVSMYLTGAEYPRLQAIMTAQRRSASQTMGLLFEEALNGNLTPDLTKRTKIDESKRANMLVDATFKARLDAYKASSEGLSMSEILMRIVEAYEAKNTTQGAAK